MLNEEALKAMLAAFNDDQRLLPVVVQDEASREVLMLAYVNREALRLSVDTGRATYFSRSRNELWVKGESSGNVQELRSVSFDCDSDALLFVVHQVGVACHTGERTCFHNEIL